MEACGEWIDPGRGKVAEGPRALSSPWGRFPQDRDPKFPVLQKDIREVVAIKCVAKKSLNKASVENLLTEIEILKGIRHPHIVQLKDFQVRAWGGAPS